MRPPDENPIAQFLERQPTMVLDGGLATSLEARGHDLDDPLWSAKVLIEAPDAIRQLHLDFLEAGADCIVSSTYQASFAGLAARGLNEDEAAGLLNRSVELAVEARDAFWNEAANRSGRLRPLVAASVGPYGAFLADGSEYRGDYSVSEQELREFHRRRWHVLAASAADLLACETIPSHIEAAVLRELSQETPERWAWMSYSCRDGVSLNDGSGLREAARADDAAPRIAAVGVNCTAPRFVTALMGEARKGTGKPLIVYPNSGEHYDAALGTWAVRSKDTDWAEAAREWAQLGASGIGGCCRIGPHDIARLRQWLTPIRGAGPK